MVAAPVERLRSRASIQKVDDLNMVDRLVAVVFSI